MSWRGWLILAGTVAIACLATATAGITVREVLAAWLP